MQRPDLVLCVWKLAIPAIALECLFNLAKRLGFSLELVDSTALAFDFYWSQGVICYLIRAKCQLMDLIRRLNIVEILLHPGLLLILLGIGWRAHPDDGGGALPRGEDRVGIARVADILGHRRGLAKDLLFRDKLRGVRRVVRDHEAGDL